MAVLKTRLASMGAEERKRILTEANAADTSASVMRKRGRAPTDAVRYLDGPLRNQEERCRADALRLVSVADKEVVKGHAQ